MKQRMCKWAGFGIACYEGEVTGNWFTGKHVGLVGTMQEADKWLKGQDVEMVKVFDDTNKEFVFIDAGEE